MNSGSELIDRAEAFGERAAIVDRQGEFTYRRLLDASECVAARLLAAQNNATDLAEARVAFLVPPGFEYVAAQWGIWRAGGIAVPLATMHPPAEWAYTIDDAQTSIVVAHGEFADRLRPLTNERGLPLITVDDVRRTEFIPFSSSTTPKPNTTADTATQSFPTIDAARRAMILYTSGTTSRPKGVVTTHATIVAQIKTLVDAWRWTADDRILLVLPLHHVHGIINVLSCALWSGAVCEMRPKFDAAEVWQRFAAEPPLSLFMAVPTIYARLISAWQTASEQERQAWSAGCRRMRLMVSGSAALPVTTLETWRGISSHTLLERYGMTEIGMGLSNPYDGERHPGCVGSPLPGVEIRLVGEDGAQLAETPLGDGRPGEIQVRGPCVFREYWQRPEATREAFTADGWFKTGDVAERKGGVYRILGRDSVDIIKTGGYKVSALEIEEVLRTHEAVEQCAVVGLEDAEWGQRVAAAIVCKRGATVDAEQLKEWLKQQLAPYKCPRQYLLLDDLPRNAMGKVTKPAVAALFA
jgi:malonyl-CoA/methylmalonyl-CoA synthetase